jgi:hypothetical protein
LSEGPQQARCRLELGAKKLSELQRIARAGGSAADAIEAALDGPRPRETLIAVIVARTPAQGSDVPRAVEASAALHAELAPLSVRDLRKRAVAVGVDGALLEEARDSEDPRAEICALIVEKELVTAGAGPSFDERKAALLAELALLSLRELRQRAVDAGVESDALEDARDGEDPKAEISALIVQKELAESDARRHAAAGPSLEECKAALRAELSLLSVRDLRKRAVAAGVDGDALEDARDGDDPRAEMSALIEEAELVSVARSAEAPTTAVEAPAAASPPEDRPHFGTIGTPEISAANAEAAQQADDKRWAMLSYQWDSQPQVSISNLMASFIVTYKNHIRF